MLHLAGMERRAKLLTVEEVWEAIGRDRIGREALYAFCRKHGVRIGKRFLVSSAKVDALLEGRLEELEKTPRGGARG